MPDQGQIAERAREILKARGAVWDMTLPWVQMYWSIDLLRRYHEAGYTYVSLTIQDLPATFNGVLRDITAFRKLCEPHSDWLVFAGTGEEIDAGREAGKLVLGLNVQDTALVHEDFDRLSVLRSLGVRHMLLAYQLRNRAADGCAEPANAGLSLFGQELVRRMNKERIVVDCSHVGKQSTLDAMEVSSAPVIFSHSGIRALCEHIRNIDDEQIKACAATGGAIGIVGIGAFLGDPQAKAETVFRNIDYVAQLVGAEHAGIGTDYIDDLGPIWPGMIAGKKDMWRDPSGNQLYEGVAFSPEQLSELVELMIGAGYSDTDIQGILGDNFRRVYSVVEGTAATQSAIGAEQQQRA